MNPFQLMAILNILLGFGRAALGYALFEAGTTGGALEINSPLTYFVSGLISILFGIGNWFRWQLATIGSIMMIAFSYYDSQYGASNQDWRFWVLTGYVVILSILVLWSYFDTAKEMKAKTA